MGYPVSAKAQEIAHNLASNLLQRFSAGALATLYGGPIPVTEAFDANGLPTISVGTLTTTSIGAFIQVGPVVWPLGTDILGNPAAIYTPTTIRVAIEASPAGPLQTTDAAILQALQSETAQTGCRIELWTSPSGTAPSDTTFNTASNFVGAFDSFQYPLVSTM